METWRRAPRGNERCVRLPTLVSPGLGSPPFRFPALSCITRQVRSVICPVSCVLDWTTPIPIPVWPNFPSICRQINEQANIKRIKTFIWSRKKNSVSLIVPEGGQGLYASIRLFHFPFLFLFFFSFFLLLSSPRFISSRYTAPRFHSRRKNRAFWYTLSKLAQFTSCGQFAICFHANVTSLHVRRRAEEMDAPSPSTLGSWSWLDKKKSFIFFYPLLFPSMYTWINIASDWRVTFDSSKVPRILSNENQVKSTYELDVCAFYSDRERIE